MSNFKEIVIWIIIFVVGSLIVSFLVYPETFIKFTENVKNTMSNTEASKSNDKTIRIIPSDEFYGYTGILYQSCARTEAMGESQGISNMKQKVCREACGMRNMEYYSTDCEIDLFVCYCLINE